MNYNGMNFGVGETVLHRYEGNPVIKPTDIEGAYTTFNCAQTMYKGKYMLLVAVQKKTDKFPAIHLAESTDGVNFEISKEPFIAKSTHPIWGELDGWTIDPRITYVEEDDMYYILRPLSAAWGTATLLCRTKDFKSVEEIDIIALPHNRVPCLFPNKINGKYVRIDRPYSTPIAPGSKFMEGNMWISYSEDLIHWGEHRPLMMPGHGAWCLNKLGPTPPIKTDKGWLEIIHGVTGNTVHTRYSLGAILLDLEDPTKIIGKTKSPILTPDAPYEYMGQTPNAVFACGAIADEEKDEIRVYYGAADTYVGLATGKLSELIDMCINEK